MTLWHDNAIVSLVTCTLMYMYMYPGCPIFGEEKRPGASQVRRPNFADTCTWQSGLPIPAGGFTCAHAAPGPVPIIELMFKKYCL